MITRLSVMLCAIFLSFLTVQARAESRFALYFNSASPSTKTIIIYNESSQPLALNLNAKIDWESAESVINDETANILVPGDLISFRQDFERGDCITIESEIEELALSINSDRDSIYVYATEGLDKGRVIKEN